MIHVIDSQLDEIVAIIPTDEFWDDDYTRSLETMVETFEYTTFANKPYSEYLTGRNKIIITDEDSGFREMIIWQAEKLHAESKEMLVFTKASYNTLNTAQVIKPKTLESQKASAAAGIALNNTEWRVGVVESEATRTIHIEKHTNPYALLKRIATEYSLELNFRIEISGNKITGRYVDLVEQIGQWRGREIEFGKDLLSIRRREATDNIYTALVGLGPEKEDGTRLEVFVEDKEALQRWGRPDPVTGNLQHIIGTYEPQSTDQNMNQSRLHELTENELEKRVKEVIEYEVGLADLEHVPGMENEKIRFGDTLKIKDTKFNPPLYVEARVFEVSGSIKRRGKKKVKLGDFIEYTEEEVLDIWRSLQDEINRKIGLETMMKYAEPKKVMSDTPPEQNENVIWVDTSLEPYVPKVHNFGEWQKMTPTESYEVGAYNKSEVDDISKDASRLTEGIIDVDSVPLRTSVTGARIAWDGVNGLIQYDMEGNVVGRMSLDGTSYFKNGYFEGEIQAQTGHFSGDVSGASGTFGNVTVKNGDFTLEDDVTSTPYSATPKRNLIKDHSFELIRQDPDSLNSDSLKYNWLEILPNKFPLEDSHWERRGSPKVAIQFAPDSKEALAMFGEKAIIVRNANYVRQYVYEGVGAGSIYTVSAFFKRQWQVVGGGIPRIEIWHVNAAGNRVSKIVNSTFDSVNNDYSISRHATTFSVPSSFVSGDSLEVIISGGNDKWVQCDGVQMVEGSISSVYQPEDSIWEIAKGNYRPVQKMDYLWNGYVYPLDNQTIYPQKTLDQCVNGWVLEWSRYYPGEGLRDIQFHHTYIPKQMGLLHAGESYSILVPQSAATTIHKYLYIYNNRIKGHADNDAGSSERAALRAVYEW
ncbi:phage tail spike protein [Virgibacillus sp. Bac332]|uniref:phage tail spike protein n=1 Tax=Virgibacillus sp. Bac332 TaxID=2419842 RepID=UPI000EF50EDC|nr:phage tail spike protein [Virgibacillus sp. Bac332]